MLICNQKINYYQSSHKIQYLIGLMREYLILIHHISMMIILILMILLRNKGLQPGAIVSCMKRVRNAKVILISWNTVVENLISQIIDLYMVYSRFKFARLISKRNKKLSINFLISYSLEHWVKLLKNSKARILNNIIKIINSSSSNSNKEFHKVINKTTLISIWCR